jgi:hypothetical protein
MTSSITSAAPKTFVDNFVKPGLSATRYALNGAHNLMASTGSALIAGGAGELALKHTPVSEIAGKVLPTINGDVVYSISHNPWMSALAGLGMLGTLFFGAKGLINTQKARQVVNAVA